jgi:uncharacterized protein (UPF0332 family)
MRAVGPARSSNYLIKAENSLRMARIAFEQGAYDNAVMSSVHSAINSLDALTTSYLGKRSSGSHTDVIILIKGIFTGKDHSDIAKQFASLMSLKNASEYQPDLMKREDAETSVIQAERIFTRVKAKLEEKKQTR